MAQMFSTRAKPLQRSFAAGPVKLFFACLVIAVAACSSEAPEMAAPDTAGEKTETATGSGNQGADKAAAERAEEAETAARKAAEREAAERETAARETGAREAAEREAVAKAEADDAARKRVREVEPPAGTATSSPDVQPSQQTKTRTTRGVGSPATPPPGSATGADSPDVAPAQAEKDWTVVPVYYGTDRARKDQPERIDYNWERGRRLELGRALVTIPKEHEVPKVERPWAIKIPYTNIKLYEAAEDPKRHFTIQEIKALTREEFLAFVKDRLASSSRFKDHAVVFVHGYQTQFDSAVYRTAQITYDMDFDGAAFLYSWPSGGTLQGYTYDRESAAQAEIYLRQFLTMVAQETGAKTVSVIAHSMGNQLVLRVLQDLKRSLPEGLKLSQLILAAPDVDRDSFENIVSSITGVAKGITLYAAANDQALQISRRVNGGVPRAGDVPTGGPLVVEGVDTIDATATSMDTLGINHSGYAENNALLNDIKQLIQTGLRPPESRVPTLERITTDRGDYWRYPAAQP